MRTFLQYPTDFGAPPPPPPPSMSTPPPPPSSGGMNMNTGGSAGTNAIIALVAGILSYIFCPFILGIVNVVLSILFGLVYVLIIVLAIATSK